MARLSGKSKTVPTVIGVAALLGGFWLALWLGVGLGVGLWTDGDEKAEGPAMVLFWPGTDGDEALMALASAGARPMRPAIGGWMWLVAAPDDAVVERLRQSGALIAPPPPLGVVPAGCAGLVKSPGRLIP